MTKSPVIIDFSLENDGLGSCVRHEHMLSKDFRLQKKLLRNIPRSLVAATFTRNQHLSQDVCQSEELKSCQFLRLSQTFVAWNIL